ncbi:A/G-specific DNA-adenine glycosylase [Dichotomicrobium thermohalophilum]|uniref:Adenine DNA glycosylase n=1 Tax=Dichotomicrobium thermohalophilum TaxID=933063 RepID=A0A397Q5S7_9HYPH|nr:A/G-specific adenine glycosylase [Dichotomicrobium thermohalophilum]RIA56408.1 A/G-specific DNA-adenine glycosylase [Dichotomicrobium thermohalophilum]
MAQSGAVDIAEDLLAWYDVARRDLPWRAPPGQRADPYHVWLSEMMLQQTTVKAVAPYYRAFLARWPRIEDMARAPVEDVLAAWAGLGYYARARNMHKTARIVADELGGRFPRTAGELVKLPGIGPYTAAAIAAIAFDEPATVVDGNVERVVARLFAVRERLPGAKPKLRSLAETLTPRHRPGDFAQAMMDLGATICTPRTPACSRCPLRADCQGLAEGVAATLPLRAPKAERPQRRGAAFVARRPDDHVLLRRRPEKGLLGGMMEPPTTEWRTETRSETALLGEAPVAADWRRVLAPVTHTFTHFHLMLDVYTADVPADTPAPDACRWVAAGDLPEEALPSVMRKVLAAASESLVARG